MQRPLLVGSAALLGGTLLLPAFQPYLFFFLLNGCVLLNAVLLYFQLSRSTTWTDAILGVAALALAQITVTQLYLGLMGYLTLLHIMLAQLVCLGMTSGWILWKRLPWPSVDETQSALQRVVRDGHDLVMANRATTVACLIALCVFSFLFTISALNPPISFDAIFYHLVHPVEWIQSGKIDIQISPEEANPHGPGLITTWLLLPFHHDFMARWGQTPFLLLGCLAAYGICRLLEMDRPLSFITALVVMTMPEYLSSGVTLTEPDTQVAGMVLVSFYYSLALARNYRRDTVLFLALSLGLVLSAKLSSFVYGAPITALIIYVWGRALFKDLRTGNALAHGVILMCTPVIVGGASYLYHHSVVGPVWDINYRSTVVFDISSFVLSTESLKKMGLGVLVSAVSVYGLITTLRRPQWHLLGPVLFLIFSVCFSLIIYAKFGGGYEGPRATRHLLTTVVLCVILAGWGVSRLRGQAFQYGVWGLVAVICIAACLGAARHWPVHRMHTRLISIALAGSTVMVFWHMFVKENSGLVSLVRRFYSPTAIVLSCWLFIIALFGWERVYREHKYYTWPTWFGFGSSWGMMAHMTEREGARIAHNSEIYPYRQYGLYAPYPLYGADLQNTLVLLHPAVAPEQSAEQQRQYLEAWEKILREQQVDYVYSSTLGADMEQVHIVRAWMDAHPDTFIPVYFIGRERIYRLAWSAHAAQAL